MEKGVDFKHEIIDLSNKPRNFVAKYKEASGGQGNGLVPLLEDGETKVIESMVVAEYVCRTIEGKDGKGRHLYPARDSKDEELILKFTAEWQRVTDTYYDVLRATSQKEVDKRMKQFISILSGIDEMMGINEGKFILGKEFSYAECISAPWVQRFFVTMPYFRGVQFDDILYDFKSLKRWMDAVCSRPSCLSSKCPEGEMIAACKRYYVSYLSKGAKGTL